MIVLDLNMPVMNGREALSKLRSIPRYSDTPVVVFATSSSPSDRDFVTALGAQFITKPLGYPEYKK
ncbi:hypothetical protein BUE76_00175 [Cnuella takakiae]|nr:hypothetical protein BUE76_00175 [Cnuella takakiae]